MTATLYKNLSDLTSKYFEASSQYFLDDLIIYHLSIDPVKLSISGLKSILDWLEIAASMLIYDKQAAKTYITKVRKLVGG